MKNKTIYLISGYKRSGKDTISDFIVELIDAKKLTFANSIKQLLSKTFNISIEELDNLKNQEDIKLFTFSSNVNIRQIIQNFGQSAKEFFGDDIWISQVQTEIMMSDDTNFVISDLRLQIEKDLMVEFAKEFGYNIKTILLQRDDITSTDTHISEQLLPIEEFDLIIDNSNCRITKQELKDLLGL